MKPEFISEIAAELPSRSIREADKGSPGAAPADGT